VWSGTPQGFDDSFRQRDYDLETATKVRDDQLYLDGEASHIRMFRHDTMTPLTGVRIEAGAASPPHATAPVAAPGVYWLLASSARMSLSTSRSPRRFPRRGARARTSAARARPTGTTRCCSSPAR
jgi:hypothetical protein